MIALDPIVATGLPHSAQLHPPIQYVAILKTEQFAPEQPNRVANILQQVPRLHPNEQWGRRSGINSLDIRGADPNCTLGMLDGIPMNDSTNQYGGPVDLSTIPLDRID